MKISGVILSKNNEDLISDAIESLIGLCDEIIVLDGASTDKTREIAKKLGAKVFLQKKGGYAVWRNQGLESSRGEWIFYLDSDERIDKILKKEIEETISKGQYSYYAIPRKNKILGKDMYNGGWWPDYVKRLFKKSELVRWEKDLHEEPIVRGEMGYLKSPILHLKHDNLTEMVIKTNKWSVIEAELMLDGNHPKMSWWRFLRIMLTEVFFRLIYLKGLLDKQEGIIYALYQMWSKFISYAKLWEMQKTKGLK